MSGRKGFEEGPADIAEDSRRWQTTERLLETLNKELGGLKEYVLTELRGEITALRSEKVQLQSQVQELRHQREALLNDIQSRSTQLDSVQPNPNNVRQIQHSQALPSLDEQRSLQHQLTDVTLDSIELPAGASSNSAGDAREVDPELQEADVSLMEMPDLAWREPGLAEDTGSTGRPTDVASVLSAMPDLRPPAKTGPNSQAAAMPSPPRLTTPVPASPVSANPISVRTSLTSEAADNPEMPVEDEAGGDEAFIADFPINAVRPDVSGFPAVGDETGKVGSQVGRQGLAFMDPSAGEVGNGRIAMPPGMVDRVGDAAAAMPQPPAQPVSPWIGEPPTRISSLIELTDSREAGSTGASSNQSITGDAGKPAPAIAKALSEGANTSELSELLTQSDAAVPGDSMSQEGEGDRDRILRTRRKGAAIALAALLLGALQYGTVQVLFHGAPWIADGQGFIAATWSSALVTFWIRMLMLLPFMIVIGQGLYPSLLPEAQAVFRDRDPIPLVSIGLSGLFFFLAHFLLYGAIAMNSATPAVALFFLYPVLGQGLGWGLFNQRLSPARLLAMMPLVLGVGLLLVQWSGVGGRVAGCASALSYALFLMLTAVNGRRMHPMTLTVLQFCLAWIWAVPAVFFLPQAMPLNHVGYVMTCVLLSVTVGVGQLFGWASRRRLGAGLSAMLQGLLPLVVGLICLFVTDEVLPINQVFSVLLVSGGAIALGFQRLFRDGA